MMTTRFTTLQTPCETGLTRDRVLKANCMQQPSPQYPDTGEPHANKYLMLCLVPISTPPSKLHAVMLDAEHKVYLTPMTSTS